MNRYNTIIKNDIVNGEGVCVSFFVQGCPHRCEGCFNPETWDFEGGKPYTEETKKEIVEAISANGILRNFSVLGGEPLALQNLAMTTDIIKTVAIKYPNIKIYLWTGYNFKDISRFEVIDFTDVVIDGKFVENLKNLDLGLRGSSNQKIWFKEKGEWKIRND